MDDRLQKFARLVELGSFTRTARELHISQPALSLAINKLERELRTVLLVRTKRKLELTDAGRIVYAAAIEHRITNENLFTHLVELTRKRPDVVIGMIDSVAAAFSGTTQPLDNLEAHANVSIVVNNSRYLREAVKSLELNLAFVVQDSETHPDFDIDPVGVEMLMIVCRPDYLATAQAELDLGKLSQFVSYEQSSTSYWHISQKMRKLGITILPTFYSTSPDVMLRMVLRGKYVAALPYILTRELLRSGKLVPLKKSGQDMTVERPIDAVKVRGKILPKPLEVFLKQAQTLYSVKQGSI
jgi:DNA-binding transcriptional LysR family regulator